MASAIEAATELVHRTIAGDEVAGGVAVRVTDQRRRPMAGAEVVFRVQAGGGTVAGPGQAASVTVTVPTGVDGIARVAWKTGTAAGSQALAADLSGMPGVVFTVDALPGAPAIVEIETGGDQTGTVGLALASMPSVRLRDAHGNATPDIEVEFTPLEGSGTVASPRTKTDVKGVAASGTWILGTRSGDQSVQVRVGGVAVLEIRATALAGPAVRLERFAGHQQSATVNTPVAVSPTVVARDAWANPVPGAAVTFTVMTGGGSIGALQSNDALTSVTQASDPTGSAAVPRWVLGRVAGANQLRATLPNAVHVDFTANGRPGPAAIVRVHDGQGQSGAPGTPLAVPPAVLVADAFDNAVAEVTVAFSVSAGGGSISVASAETGANGIASAGPWTLGPIPGQNRLDATVPGLPSASFTATGASGGGGGGGGGTPGGFSIDLRYANPVSPAQQAALEAGAGRWMSAVTGDLPSVPVSVPANACGVSHSALTETVDDLLILISVEDIDGPGRVLGSAGPCLLRSASGLPVLGVILLDASDLAMLEGNSLLAAVIEHEMGHVLGVGTLWQSPPLVGAGTTDPYFIGAGAVSAFLAAGGSSYPGAPVPVENSGGGGTRDGHWRESIFGSELMTGWINAGGNPLSAITIASLQDIGYQINAGAADGFSVSGSIPAQQSDREAGIEIRERPLPVPPVHVDAQGRRTGTPPR